MSEDLVTIWRYEDDDGNGPYMALRLNQEAQDVQDRLHRAHRGRPRSHPGGGADFECQGGFWGHHDYVFGCPSREIFNAWFLGFHTDLKAVGFRVKAYRVPARHVMRGRSGRQVAFRRHWQAFEAEERKWAAALKRTLKEILGLGGRPLPYGDVPPPPPPVDVLGGPEPRARDWQEAL